MTIPTYLPYFIAAGTVAVLITILYGLNRALADAHWPAADRTRTLRVSAVILLGWLAVAITLSAMGIYHVTSGDRPTISIRHPAADSDRRPDDLAIGNGQARAPRGAPTVACRRATFSRARRDFSDPLCNRDFASPLCLTRWPGRHRRRPLGTRCGSCQWVGQCRVQDITIVKLICAFGWLS